MGYYVRVLSTSADCVALSALQSVIEKGNLQATLSADEGAPDDWEQLILGHADGRDIALIERNLVEEGSLGAGELSVLDDGQWRPFQMDLGNLKQRESFFRGQIPNGVKLL